MRADEDERLVTRTLLPTRLELEEGAMAMDGGSLALEALDQAGRRVDLRLDWSIRALREGTAQLYVDDVPVPRASPEEAAWLALVRDAGLKTSSESPTAGSTPISAKCVVLADDVAGYFDAIERGPEAAVSWLAARLVALVSSATYREGRAAPELPAPEENIRSLVMQGEMVKAIVAYRQAHPDVGVMAARAMVKALATESEEEIAHSAAPPESAPAGGSPASARQAQRYRND